jgi:hypothetical protein
LSLGYPYRAFGKTGGDCFRSEARAAITLLLFEPGEASDVFEALYSRCYVGISISPVMVAPKPSSSTSRSRSDA